MGSLKMEISKSVKMLINQQTILYPTDTVWGLGCDATDAAAVSKIYALKNRVASKSLIVLVSSVEMLQSYVADIPRVVLGILERASRPTTIIYNNPKGLAKNVIAQEQTVAIRIVKEGFCHDLIREFGRPIVSTSANVSGQPTPKSYAEISPLILDRVDYVVALHQNQTAEKTSTILKITEAGEVVVLRD